MYRIKCHVWGGVTGDRKNWLKAKDGSIYETENPMEAKKLAAELNKEMNARPKPAKFDYRVEAFDNNLGVPASEVNN